MKTISLNKHYSRRSHLIPFIISLIVSLGLFYIDEGYYNFNYLNQPIHYFLLLVYSTGLTIGVIFTKKFLFKNMAGLDKTLLNYIIGLPIGFIISLGFILFIGLINHLAF